MTISNQNLVDKNNTEISSKQPVKQPYQKPRLRTIELISDEVLATGCKSDVIGGPGPATECAPGCFEFGS